MYKSKVKLKISYKYKKTYLSKINIIIYKYLFKKNLLL